MNETTETGEIVEPSPVAVSETVGVSEDVFTQRMDGLENYYTILIIGVGILIGCVIASMVMRWFHND